MSLSVALVAAGSLTSGCRVGIGNEVGVDRGGGGAITVTVTADDDVRDALSRGGLGDFGDSLFGTAADRRLPAGNGSDDAFADLRDAGWQVDAVSGGIRLSRDFAPGEDLGPALASLGGGDVELSPIRALSVAKRGGFPRDHIEASGSAGLSADAITQLATGTGTGSPTQAEIENVVGMPLADLVSVQFRLDLPGSVDQVDADPAPAASGDLTWDLPGGRMLTFRAESSFWNGFVTLAVTLVVVVVVAFAAFVVWRRIVVVRRRRQRRRPARAR